MRFSVVERRDSHVAMRARRACKKPSNQRAPATRATKKPIFLDENARCATCERGAMRSRAMTCVARAPQSASGDRATVVTCDDSRALKHDVNGLQEFLKSVG
jgi:hypothetical protein